MTHVSPSTHMVIFLIRGYLLYNIVLASAIHQYESAIDIDIGEHMYTHILLSFQEALGKGCGWDRRWLRGPGPDSSSISPASRSAEVGRGRTLLSAFGAVGQEGKSYP